MADFMVVSKKWSSANGIIEWHADVRHVVSVTEFEQYRSLPTKEYKLGELFRIGSDAYVVNEHGCLYSLDDTGSVNYRKDFSGFIGQEFHWQGIIYRAYAVE